MQESQDFKEFIELLNKNKVRYLIVGGYAYSYYVEPRFTKDIDFLIESFVLKGFQINWTYYEYVCAHFSYLFTRQRELPFGKKGKENLGNGTIAETRKFTISLNSSGEAYP